MSRLGRFAALLLVVFGAVVPVGAQGLTLQVTSPRNGDTVNHSNVTIDFQVSGFKLVPSTVPLAEAGKRPDANRPGEGHLHFMLDLQPVIVWEQNASYTLENVAAGEHQLMVEVVNNDHSSLSPPVIQQIRFRTAMVMPATGQERGLSASEIQIGLIAAVLLVTGALCLRRSAPRRRDTFVNGRAIS